MENLLTRHRNVTILVAVLFAEVIGLAVQVKRTSDTNSSRLLRVWTVSAVTPLEKGLLATQQGISNTWHSYFYLRGVRAKNQKLQEEIEQLRLQQVRLAEDAGQARRLQRLLGFKEQFIAKTVAAQVIGSSGSDMSRVVYIDKGEGDGIRQDMAVITADGVVGKVLRVFPTSSQVLLINDPSSGVGAILEKSRLQGVIKGTPNGELVLEKTMSDERVEPGDQLLTSGGDQIFPKGLPIGMVKSVSPGKDIFLSVRVKPAAQLSRLEEVLVITQVVERQPTADEAKTSMRAVDILAARLPSVPDNPRLPATGVPLPVGARPAAATPKPGEAKTEIGLKPKAKPAVPGAAAQNAIGSHPRPKSAGTAEAQLGNPNSAPVQAKPKTAVSSQAGMQSNAGGATAPDNVVVKKPRPAKPAAAALSTGSSTSADAPAAAAPTTTAPKKPKTTTGTGENPAPNVPPAETPQP